MVDRKRRYNFLIVTFIIVIVFILGVILGRSFAAGEIDKLTRSIKESELNIESFTIEQELLSENCELAEARVSSLSSELYALGKILTDPNAKEEIGEENYRMLQKRYHLSQIKTYLFFKKLKQRCNETSPIILYYYKPNDAKSKEQGIILDSLVADNKNLHVFAIEYNFSKELTFLERAYGIYDAPALVINYKDVRVGLTKKEDILKKV